MAFGSWLRFGVGIVLALEVLRSQFLGSGESVIAAALAVILLALSAAYFLFKF